MNKPVQLEFKSVGQPVRRKEDERLIQGHGRFTDDFSAPGQVYAAIVRSPHPHAKILSIDAAAVRAMPGVLDVFTGADCLAEDFGPIPHNPVPKTQYDMKLTGPDGTDIFIGPAFASAGRQGAPCRRSRGHGGGRDSSTGSRRRRGPIY